MNRWIFTIIFSSILLACSAAKPAAPQPHTLFLGEVVQIADSQETEVDIYFEGTKVSLGPIGACSNGNSQQYALLRHA